jgi:hypothetical protein
LRMCDARVASGILKKLPGSRCAVPGDSPSSRIWPLIQKLQQSSGRPVNPRASGRRAPTNRSCVCGSAMATSAGVCPGGGGGGGGSLPRKSESKMSKPGSCADIGTKRCLVWGYSVRSKILPYRLRAHTHNCAHNTPTTHTHTHTHTHLHRVAHKKTRSRRETPIGALLRGRIATPRKPLDCHTLEAQWLRSLLVPRAKSAGLRLP